MVQYNFICSIIFYVSMVCSWKLKKIENFNFSKLDVLIGYCFAIIKYKLFVTSDSIHTGIQNIKN